MTGAQKKFECLISGRHAWQNIKIFQEMPHRWAVTLGSARVHLVRAGPAIITAHYLCKKCGVHRYVNSRRQIDIIGTFSNPSCKLLNIDTVSIDASVIKIVSLDKKQTVIFNRDSLSIIEQNDTM